MDIEEPRECQGKNTWGRILKSNRGWWVVSNSEFRAGSRRNLRLEICQERCRM